MLEKALEKGVEARSTAHLQSFARYQTLEISDCCRCCGVVFGACDAFEYSTLSIMMPTDISALIISENRVIMAVNTFRQRRSDKAPWKSQTKFVHF